MKTLLSVLLLSAAIALPAFGDTEYSLDKSASVISFATIKKQYIVEPATLENIEGNIEKSGNFTISAKVSGIDTGIAIRNERLAQLFFQTDLYPQVKITGKLSPEVMEPKKLSTRVTVPADVTLYGKTRKMDFPIQLIKTRKMLVAYSTKPVIIRAEDFGIPAENLNKLAETVGGIQISSSVAVNVNLVFSH